MKQDSVSKFYRVDLTPEESARATEVSPYFLAYLQNKIEAYASAVVDAKLPYSCDPNTQVEAILAHERLRNYVQAYEELLSELLQSSILGQTN
jgi:hypothetical protein